MKRILLKISGEVLKGEQEGGLCDATCRALVRGVQSLMQESLQVGIVVGGGNYFRGKEAADAGMARTPADHMGMLATIMNGIALEHYFLIAGVKVHVMSALDCPQTVESYEWRRAMELLNKGELVIFVGGTGNPYFTTDTAAALRASEMGADLLMKATKVDGVYTKDPKKFKEAKKLVKTTYDEVLEQNLAVMDQTAFSLCKESQIPILIFNMDLLIDQASSLAQMIDSGSLVSY